MRYGPESKCVGKFGFFVSSAPRFGFLYSKFGSLRLEETLMACKDNESCRALLNKKVREADKSANSIRKELVKAGKKMKEDGNKIL